ncbi:MAG: hypothetical protein U1E63_10990 [Burkholderiales bacterium]
MTNKHVMSVASGICSATLLFALGGTAYGHDDDWSRTDKPLVWVDAKGKTIGRAVGGDSSGGGAVQLKIHGLSLIVPVGNRIECGPGQFPFSCDSFLAVTWRPGGVMFTEADCKGDAYVTTLSPGSERAVGIYGQTLYVGDGKPKSTSVSFKSVVILGLCDSNVSPPPFNTAPGWKVEKTPGLWTLGFKPPFSLR